MLIELLSGGSDMDTAVVVGGVAVPSSACVGLSRWVVGAKYQQGVGCLLASGKLFVKRG